MIDQRTEAGASGSPSAIRFEPRRRTTRLIVDVLLLSIVILTPLGFVRAYIQTAGPDNLIVPFSDATTYLAAGERLNAGHELYRLVPGDRPVLILEDYFTAPLLSPPPIAVAWRPLAAVDWGLTLWVVACWIVLLGTVIWLVVDVGARAVPLVFLLSLSIGEDLYFANASAFFPALYLLAWRYRHHAAAGIPIGIMAVIKLAPVAMVAWLLAASRLRGAIVAVATIAVLGLLGVLGAGLDSYWEYLSTLSGAKPSPESLSGLTGISWASYALFVAGIAAAIAFRSRPGLSFGFALVAAVLGTPSVHMSGLVPLLALLGPLTGQGRGLFRRAGVAPIGRPEGNGAESRG